MQCARRLIYMPVRLRGMVREHGLCRPTVMRLTPLVRPIFPQLGNLRRLLAREGFLALSWDRGVNTRSTRLRINMGGFAIRKRVWARIPESIFSFAPSSQCLSCPRGPYIVLSSGSIVTPHHPLLTQSPLASTHAQHKQWRRLPKCKLPSSTEFAISGWYVVYNSFCATACIV